MTEIELLHSSKGCFVAHTPSELEKCSSIKVGSVVKCKISTMNNYKFHSKLMALFRFAFENMPETEHNKSFEVFRNDLTVLAGHYDQVFSLNGKGFKLVAKSFKYSKMTDHEKQKVYNDLCQVIIDRVLTGYTLEQLLECVDNTAAKFAGFL